MLRLSEIRDAYERSSEKLSEINRQLCFAGFAVIWIFNNSTVGLAIPRELYLPLTLWCVSLVLDILQYAFKTGYYYWFYLKRKRPEKNSRGEIKSEDEMVVEESENPTIVLWCVFILKIVAMTSGYILLLIYLISKIS